MAHSGNITQLLRRADPQSVEELFSIVYDELHAIAASLFKGEYREGHTLQPTALVHEAYLRLAGNLDEIPWQSRAHFFGIAARSMRQILVNHAVAHNAEKRGGGQAHLALDDAISFFQTRDIELIALNESLERLNLLDARQAEIVELRFFGGLTIEETAQVTGLSASTVKREWEMAKAWLYRDLSNGNTKGN